MNFLYDDSEKDYSGYNDEEEYQEYDTVDCY